MTKGSTLPILQMELIDDGRNDFTNSMNAYSLLMLHLLW